MKYRITILKGDCSHGIKWLITFIPTLCLACSNAFAVEPVELPKAEPTSVEIYSPSDSISPIPNAALTENFPVAKLTSDSLPSGYGYSVFSSAPLSSSQEWWLSFDDPVLNKLEALARRNNYNLKSTLKQLEASRQILKQTRAGYWPTLSLNIGYDYTKDSGRESLPYSKPSPSNYYQAGAAMSWEIDIFGRIAQRSKIDKANIEVTRIEYEGLLLSVAAEVATQYSNLVMYEEQIQVALTHLKTQENILAIAEARYKAGLVSKLDVAQANSMVSQTRLLIPGYTAQATTARNALAALCGVSGMDIEDIMGESALPHLKVPIDIGVPADLIRRRPDVAEAEMQIHSLAAKLGVAKKDYLPTLSINATIGTSSREMQYLFGSHSLNFEIAPTLSWTLFDGGSRRAGVAQAKALMESEIESYNMTLTNALKEAENAMENYIAAGREVDLYYDVLESTQEVVDLSLERYRHGLTDFTDVANAQITYLQNNTNYQTSRSNLFNCIVNLYKALGGGFSGLKVETYRY